MEHKFKSGPLHAHSRRRNVSFFTLLTLFQKRYLFFR